jgi:hypothetical protein
MAILVIGIAALGLVFWVRRTNLASRRAQSAVAAAIDDYRRRRDKADLGLVCPVCRAVADPLPGTHDRYRCTVRGEQFAAEFHEWEGT